MAFNFKTRDDNVPETEFIKFAVRATRERQNINKDIDALATYVINHYEDDIAFLLESGMFRDEIGKNILRDMDNFRTVGYAWKWKNVIIGAITELAEHYRSEANGHEDSYYYPLAEFFGYLEDCCEIM